MTTRSASGVWKWVGLGLLVLGVGCGVVGYRLWTVVADVRDTLKPETPHMTLQAKVVNGRAEFHLTYDAAAQGVSAFTVLDEQDHVLWQIADQSVGKPPVIAYGQLPVEPGVEWRQNVPADGTAPPSLRGRRVKAVLQWNYASPNKWPGTQTAEVVIDVPE
jgi:hypothetical protein